MRRTTSGDCPCRSSPDNVHDTPGTTFKTYAFLWPAGKEPEGDERVAGIANAARELVEKRDRWLNPEGASEAELKKRTLTNLYNERPTWLARCSTRTIGRTICPTRRCWSGCSR